MSTLSEHIEKLDSPDETERTYAAEDLGYLNAPEAMAVLLERLPQEPSPVVRDAIVQALTRMDGDEAIHGAIHLLGSEDAQIRNLAVGLLRHKGDRSVPFLEKEMREGGRDMRKFVLDVLSGIQAKGAGQIYAIALADDDLNVVITAVENIGTLRDAQFRGEIESLLQGDGHPMLVAACLEALAEIGHESSLAAVRQRFPDLAQLPAMFLTPCLKALAALGTEREFTEVALLLPPRVEHLYEVIIGTLIAIHQRYIHNLGRPPELSAPMLAVLQEVVAGGAPPACRYQAAHVLGFWLDHPEVSAFLVSCLGNPERLVRLGAAEVLRKSKSPGLVSLATAHELEECDGKGAPALSR